MAWLIIIAIVILITAIIMTVLAAYSIKTARALDGGDTTTAHGAATTTAVISFILAFILFLAFVGLLYLNFSSYGKSTLASLSRRSL